MQMVIAKSGRKDDAGEVVRLVNEFRRTAGKAPLVRGDKLTKIARYRALQIVKAGRLSHDGWLATMRRFGWRNRAAGENIAAGQESAAEVVGDWMHSPEHKRNILDGDFRSIGVARVEDIWCQIFGGR